jgi:probable addiction module antidote protein
MEGVKMSKEATGKTTVSRWDTAEFLNSREDIDAYLQVAFENGDARQITKALGNVAKAQGMTDIAKKTGLTREHLYTSLSDNGNPTLQTLTAIINTLGYQLSITPTREGQQYF